MTFPLSKIELKAITLICEKVKNNPKDLFSLEEYQQWQDILLLMAERKMIVLTRTREGYFYNLIGDYDAFEKWILQEHKKAKKQLRLKWWIPIVTAIIGSVVGAIVTKYLS